MEFKFFVDLYGCVYLLTLSDSDLSDTDNIVSFENTTSINLFNLLCVLLFGLLFWLIRLLCSNGRMLSVSGKSESVNKCTHTDQQTWSSIL